MNEKENLKSIVIEACVNGKMTVKEAAQRLQFSERYVKKLKARFKNNGAQSMIHGNCGKQPKHALNAELKSKIIEIRNQPEFEECNIQHFKELLSELENIEISYTALYCLLSQNGFRSPRKRRKNKVHKRRNPRSSEGELLQVDGTPYEFFYGDKKQYSLHGFIDDATGKITGLYMCENECMHGYLEVTRQTIKNFGIPLALYADGSSIFFPKSKELTIEEQLAGISKPTTQYGKMMATLGVHLIAAGSSQAKGKIERLWNTLHDRLRTEFRIHKITTIEQANKYFEKFIPKYNEKFEVAAENPETSYMELPKYIDLDYVLSVKYTRIVDASNSVSIQGTTFVIDTRKVLHKKQVEICISKKIGIKVKLDNEWYKLNPLVSSNKKSLKSNDSIETIINNFIYYNCLKNERLSA